jgi:phosphohistidine phosphatase
MILYIVRHSDAVPSGTPGVSEDDRPLTEKGIKKMREVARGLRAIDVAPELILSSPLPRARRTAEIILEEMGGRIQLKLTSTLAPSGSRSELYRELRTDRKLSALMIVGHQPGLGEIAGEIAWGSAEHYLELKKGGVCALEVGRLDPTPAGALLWLLTPAISRQIRP